MRVFAFSEIKDFFTDGERNQIARKIYDLKPLWKKLHDYDVYKDPTEIKESFSKNQYLLGDSIYPIKPKNYSEINQETQKILKAQFTDLIYSKLFSTFPTFFEEFGGIEYYPNLPIPGFHIFSGKQKEEPFGYHEDTSLMLWDQNIKPKRLFSFLSPILLPQNGAHLEWLDGNMSERKLPYKYNTLHIWHGLVKHRIGRHALNNFETRITLQGHLYITPEHKIQLFF
jgi:hypothetical protein